jgi:ABC-type branched-subunit amino acid transport system substrate-binding protein
MKTKSVYIPVVILIALFVSSLGWADDEGKIVVMNPRGIMPETVYIVDTKYPNTKPFVKELQAALKAKYPKTTWVLRDKFAGYMDDDPNLWKEIKEKGAGAIVLLGH